MIQPTLFDKPADPPPCTEIKPKFHGETYVAKWDEERLTKQLRRVYECMRDGRWRTLREISDITGDSEASISARIRQLHNDYGLVYERRRRGKKGSGLFEYRLVLEQGGGGG